MLKERFDRLREGGALVHNITNYVTVNDVANILLAAGASPIMSDDIEDAPEITAICGGLNINIGTLNQRTVPAMFASGKKARELGHPVLLDPVGAGASSLRTQTAVRLMKEVGFTAVRGNISEIKTLATGSGTTRGVDADVADAVTEENLDKAVEFVKAFAEDCGSIVAVTGAIDLGSGTTRGVDADVADAVTEENLDKAVEFVKAFAEDCGSIVAVTGAIDLVTDGKICYIIRNGRKEMGQITGTGCQLSALMTAFLTVNRDEPLEAAAAAVCAMGLAGEIGWKNMLPGDGNSTYRNRIIDAIYNMDGKQLEEGAKIEIR